MKMKKNGLKSCREMSRHTNIRYYFSKDVLEREGIDLKHCRTEIMLAYFFNQTTTEEFVYEDERYHHGDHSFPN